MPGTKKKVWVLFKEDQSEDVDAGVAATLRDSSSKATYLGAFQQQMRRYRLELAQCNGHIGCALLRTFVDVFLFDMYAETSDALKNGACLATFDGFSCRAPADSPGSVWAFNRDGPRPSRQHCAGTNRAD